MQHLGAINQVSWHLLHSVSTPSMRQPFALSPDWCRYSYFDTRIVRRSNMLLADMGGKPYGKSLNFLQFSVLPTEGAVGKQS